VITIRPTALMGRAICSLNLRLVSSISNGCRLASVCVLPKNIDFFFQSQVLLANNQILAVAALPPKKLFLFCEIFCTLDKVLMKKMIVLP
jgi:hypothetical protein